ncbi:MAG: hypothetical protein M0T78_11115 [Actinomycetota bacterium]|nr:hypothetical protein [Actinomycetota bacterium]
MNPSKLLSEMRLHPSICAKLEVFLAAPTNSYLFYGPSGSGKMEVARLFAASLLCPDGGCGTCATCKGVMNSNHPDFSFETSSNRRISVDDARALVRKAHLSPNSSTRRVVLIDEFDNFADVAPIMLKTIEEPPLSTVFIIVVGDLTPSIATIVSRCVTIEVPRAEDEDLVSFLQFKYSIDSQRVRELIDAADRDLDVIVEMLSDENFERRRAIWEGIYADRGSTQSLLGRTKSVMEFLDDVVVQVIERRDLELSRLKEMQSKGSPPKGVVKEVEDRYARIVRFRRRSEIELGARFLLERLKREIFSSVPDQLYASIAYEQLVSSFATLLSQLRYGSDEQMIIAQLIEVGVKKSPF